MNCLLARWHLLENCICLADVWCHRLDVQGFPGGSGIKDPPANAGDVGLIPGWVMAQGSLSPTLVPSELVLSLLSQVGRFVCFLSSSATFTKGPETHFVCHTILILICQGQRLVSEPALSQERVEPGEKDGREKQGDCCGNAKSLQSCPTFCDPMDCSLPGSSVHGILQARILEWVAMHNGRLN